jgi:hypothetical protein
MIFPGAHPDQTLPLGHARLSDGEYTFFYFRDESMERRVEITEIFDLAASPPIRLIS